MKQERQPGVQPRRVLKTTWRNLNYTMKMIGGLGRVWNQGWVFRRSPWNGDWIQGSGEKGCRETSKEIIARSSKKWWVTGSVCDHQGQGELDIFQGHQRSGRMGLMTDWMWHTKEKSCLTTGFPTWASKEILLLITWRTPVHFLWGQVQLRPVALRSGT